MTSHELDPMSHIVTPPQTPPLEREVPYGWPKRFQKLVSSTVKISIFCNFYSGIVSHLFQQAIHQKSTQCCQHTLLLALSPLIYPPITAPLPYASSASSFSPSLTSGQDRNMTKLYLIISRFDISAFAIGFDLNTSLLRPRLVESTCAHMRSEQPMAIVGLCSFSCVSVLTRPSAPAQRHVESAYR